ncbi:hypothetical protein [Reichenbachiella versicolor]|uniref:hypothetical protein n=1 Tax=Reichenbachiella versicolor TaxID=1821036 RepID=UPI000D6E3FBA|nr:hypothetical protein [Reichenbachiella versicolor]
MMKTKFVAAIAVILIPFWSIEIFAQSKNFKLGKQAYQEGRNHDAMKHLQIAVNDEKFFMKGKDIPIAYAYLALIKNRYLEANLNKGNMSSIKTNPGILKSSISDIKTAVEYSVSSNPIIDEAKEILYRNAYLMGDIITKSIMKLDFENNPNNEIKDLAALLNYELKSFSNLDSDHWQIHDMLGFTHYLLNEKDMAMTEYSIARDVYQQSNSNKVTELHLYNYLFSTRHYFLESKNYIETELLTLEAIDYVRKMAHHEKYDNMEQIKRLSGFEGIFYNIKKQLSDIRNVSSAED